MFGNRFQQDFIMRQIELIARYIAESVFKKKSTEYKIIEKENLSDTDKLHNKLVNLINENKINEAEDLLFDSLDLDNKKYLEVAIDFYSRLTKLDDTTLELNDFTKEEIAEGLADVSNKYGIVINA
mgnify:FL=1